MRNRAALALAGGALVAVAATGTALAAARDDTPATPIALSTELPSQDPSATPTDGSSASPSAGDSPSADVAPSPDRSPSPQPTRPATAGGIGADVARQIALVAAGGGRVTRIEAETEHGRAVWSIRVLNGSARHDLDVDRATGTVTDHDTDLGGRASRSTTASRDDNGGGNRGRGGDDSRDDDNRDRGRGGDDSRDGDRGRDDDRGGDDRGRRHGGHGSDD